MYAYIYICGMMVLPLSVGLPISQKTWSSGGFTHLIIVCATSVEHGEWASTTICTNSQRKSQTHARNVNASERVRTCKVVVLHHPDSARYKLYLYEAYQRALTITTAILNFRRCCIGAERRVPRRMSSSVSNWNLYCLVCMRHHAGRFVVFSVVAELE